jgi:hypothetical protein
LEVEIPSDDIDSLYPLQALVQPIALRFKYHFDGSRQTNKLEKVGTHFHCGPQLTADQPEWYFAHIQNVSHECKSFMDDIIQRLLEKSEFGRISAWVKTFRFSPMIYDTDLPSERICSFIVPIAI